MKYILIFSLIYIQFSYTQKTSDILRFGHTLPFATARSSGLANAMGAVGGDVNSMNINPAGLGLFRKSEFLLSYHLSSLNGSYLLSGERFNVEQKKRELPNGISGIGLVFSTRPRASLWRQFNIGFSYSRTADYRQVIRYEGNSRGSIAGRFLELSLDPSLGGNFGYSPDQLDNFEAGLAYETGVIFDPNPDDNKISYVNDLIGYSDQNIYKNEVVKIRGSANEFALSFAGNFDEKLSIGTSIVIPTGELQIYKKYNERNEITSGGSAFRRLSFDDSLSTEMAGLQIRLGAIYKPINPIRIGLSFQTPGILWLSDEFTTGLEYTYSQSNKDTSIYALSPIGNFKYRMITPLKLTGSLALVSSYGFISGDVEYRDFRQGSFIFGNDAGTSQDLAYEEQLNRDINKQYRAFFQYRLGGEIAIKYFRLRGGIQLIESLFANSKQLATFYHGGMGLRGNKTYVDFAYSYSTKQEAYVPFQTGNSDFDNDGEIDAASSLVQQSLRNHFFQLTFGLKF